MAAQIGNGLVPAGREAAENDPVIAAMLGAAEMAAAPTLAEAAAVALAAAGTVEVPRPASEAGTEPPSTSSTTMLETATQAAPEAPGAAPAVAAGTFGMGRDPRLEQAVAAIERQAGNDPAEARATAAAIGATVAEARVIALPEPPPMPPEVLAERLRSLISRLVA
ncbi:hypothetical protein NF552_22725 (plasmid) [Roseomonas mucosa]|nr:hypothetical protein NF552_22725 [Roseomonas mucosa]